MKKFVITVILLNTFIWFALSSFKASANDKTTVTVSHIITETIKGTDIDTSAILEKELQNLAHNYTIDMINIMQVYLPAILDGIAADLRMKADKKYKEELLNGKNDN
jgi:hypothetical protein